MPPLFSIRRKHIICRLLKCGAVSPETAKTLVEAGVINPNLFPSFTRHLVEMNVIGRTDCGRYYVK